MSADNGQLGRLLTRTNTLLADLVSAQGTARLPEETDLIPFGTITVPDDRQYYGFPKGRTTFDFGQGAVEHESEGKILNIESIRDLSRSLDSTLNELRSLSVYVDAPCQLSFDGDNTRTLEAGQHYEFTSQGFKSVEIQSDFSFDISMAASTRSNNQSVSSSGAHSERKGSREGDAYDSWETMITATPNVWEDFTVTTDLADTEWYVRPFGKETIAVVNGSASANNIDVRVQAKDLRYTDSNNIGDWYTIAEATGIAQNSRHKFVIDEPHHKLRVQFKNSTAGQTVSAGFTGIAVS